MISNADLYLPEEYRANPPASADRDGTPYWELGLDQNDIRYQVPVYKLASSRASEISPRVVVDIGCGSGDKLNEFFGGDRPYQVVGVDQESAIALARTRFEGIDWISGDLNDSAPWAQLTSLRPDLVICADVIEHVGQPLTLLHRLRALIGQGLLVLSTPDRSRLNGDPLGPPGNPRHIREWTADEMGRLAQHQGFQVVGHRHVLPRRYSFTTLEVKRLIWRLLHGRAIPDRRSCQVLELRRSPTE